jgi:hypothetical protein
MSESRIWQVRIEDTQYGPYTEQEMLQFATEGRISGETEVKHPNATQGLWVKAKVIKLLNDQFKTVPPVIEQLESPRESASERSTNSANHKSIHIKARSPIPKKFQSGWTFLLCISLEWTAIIWMGIFIWSVFPNGPGMYFMLETGNSLARSLDIPEVPINLKALAFTWALAKHAQYSLYLLATAQLLRLVERISIKIEMQDR